MLPAFRVEMAKQFRRVRTYVTLGIVVGLPILMTIAVKYGERRRGGDGEAGDSLFRLARESGLVMPAAALLFMSRFLLVVVVAIFAGDAVAGEATWGNLRYVLVRPIGRVRLLAAKLAMAGAFIVIATLLIVITGLVAGGLAFGWHRVDVDFAGFVSLHESSSQLLWHLTIATVYVMWSMTSVVALSFMVSTMSDAATGAIGAGVGLYVVSQILDAIPQLGAVRYVLPTHYLDDWRALIVANQANSDLIRGVIVQIPYVLVFCTIAFWWFRRKDITS